MERSAKHGSGGRHSADRERKDITGPALIRARSWWRDVLTAHAVGNPARASPEYEVLGNAIRAQHSGAIEIGRVLLIAQAIGKAEPLPRKPD